MRSTLAACRPVFLVQRPISYVIASLFVVCSANVLAQTSQKTEEVVVTGTLIRGAGPVGGPVVGVDRGVIDNAGVSNTTELLRQLPQIQALGTDDSHIGVGGGAQNAAQNITAGSGINLRGLGPESTLTLVEGRRFAPQGAGAQFIDPATIPTLALERVEVLTDGASATYGSDAVGGVVNMRLRKNYDGAESVVRYGSGEHYHSYQASQIFGKSWDTGNIMITVDRNVRTRLLATDTKFFTDDLRPFGGPDARTFNAQPGNIQVATSGTFQGVSCSANIPCQLVIPAGQNGVGLNGATLQVAGVGTAAQSNRQTAYKGVDYLPQQMRNSGVLTLSQSIGDHVNAFLEGFITERKYDRRVVTQTPFSTQTVTVPSTNFYRPQNIPGIANNAPLTVNYSMLGDLGVSDTYGYERAKQVAAGADFDLIGDWKGTAYAARSVNEEKWHNPGQVNSAGLTAALADNTPNALNVFCDSNVYQCNSPATIARYAAINDRYYKYTLNDGGVKADGPVFSLPAGKVSVAVGAEYHTDNFSYTDSRNNNTANTSIFNTFVTTQPFADGLKPITHRTVSSFYTEAYVPVIGKANALPWVEKLDLSLAARAERYSDFGKTTNPKVGLSWVPVQGLELHSTYSTSFRAPTLGDLDDHTGTVNFGTGRQTAAVGGATVSTIIVQGGNSNLKPEKATSNTFGFNFKPAALKGLSITVDYFNIDYKDRILQPAQSDPTVLYNPALASYVLARQPAITDPSYAAYVQQVLTYAKFPSTSGQLPTAANCNAAGCTIGAIIAGNRQNVGRVQTDGIDFSARYQWKSPIGQLTTGLAGTYLVNYKQQNLSNAPLLQLLNTTNNPLRLQMRGELGWADGGARVTTFINYTNGYTNTLITTPTLISSETTVDLSASYGLGDHTSVSLLKNLTFSLSVTNLFDRDPPYTQYGNINPLTQSASNLAFDPVNGSATGRFVALTINKKW